MPLDLDFAQSASDLFTKANKAPASEVDVSDLKTSDLVDYGSDAAKAELDKRIKNLENDYKSQLQTVLKFGSTGATVGSFFGIPVGSAIGAGVGLAVGAVLVFWDDVKGWFGGDTGLSADVREQIYAPVRAITAAHFSTDPRSWPETAARAALTHRSSMTSSTSTPMEWTRAISRIGTTGSSISKMCKHGCVSASKPTNRRAG